MSQSVNGYPESIVLPPPIYTLPAWKKFPKIRRPPPTHLFVFVDEHPDTLLDAQFGNPVGMPGYLPIWWDMPEDRHNPKAPTFLLLMGTWSVGIGKSRKFAGISASILHRTSYRII
jgi:hypothetical protein